MEDVKELFLDLSKDFTWLRVSILVLMEDVKEQSTLYVVSDLQDGVSILVLMEDVKEHVDNSRFGVIANCFNPCFNGRCKRT